MTVDVSVNWIRISVLVAAPANLIKLVPSPQVNFGSRLSALGNHRDLGNL